MILLWLGAILKNSYLTTKYSSEFIDFYEIGFDFLHPWDNEPNLRILSYSQNKATVYYYGDSGGEKVVFIKEDSKWKYLKTAAIWSSQGSADDYFIWPYYKNIVP